jgi:hypothetical protein
MRTGIHFARKRYGIRRLHKVYKRIAIARLSGFDLV